MASIIQQIETPKRARALDTSGNNNHGQIYSGRALEFDGVTDYFQHNGGTGITGTSLFANGVPWTWACWIYFDSASTSDYFFVGNDGQTQPHFLFRNNSNDNQLRFRDTNADYYTFSTTKLNSDTWYRVVITTDGTSITAYVNGVVYGTISAGQANTVADDNFDNTLMEFSGWGTPYEGGGVRSSNFHGMMSDAQVWDATWTASDVTYDYLNPESLVLSNGGTSLTESNLKIWYPMQDGHRGQQSYVLDASNTGLGDDVITDGTFPSLDNWQIINATGANQVTLDNGTAKLTYDNTVSTNALGIRQAGVLTTGVTYKITMDVVSISGNGVKLYTSGSGESEEHETLIGTGSHSIYFTAVGPDVSIYRSNSGSASISTIDNVVVKPVNDKNHATTVFHGDEQITDSKNRDFASASDWVEYSPDGSAPTFGDDGSPAYLEITGLADTDPQGATLAVSNLTTPVVGRTYRIQADIWWDSSNPGIGSVFKIAYAGATSSAFEVTATLATSGRKTVELVATSASGDLIIYYEHANQTKWFIDDVTVKEVGVASGWTDADQQLHIPQTTLQSYNEFAWSLPTTASNMAAEVVNSADFDINSSDFTANFWVYLNDHGFSNGQYLFHKGGGGAEGWHIRIRADGRADFVVHTGGSGGDGVSAATANGSANDIKVGKWYMITGVVDHGSTVALYINGELVESTSFPSEVGASDIDGSGNLGMLNWTTSYAAGTLNGTATEFSIFKGAALSKAEVQELYNDGKALDATTHSQVDNLRGYWRNDGLNTTWKNIYDPTSDNATLYNASETILIPQGLDSRDSQGFIMNRQRNTSSLNFTQGHLGVASTNEVVVEDSSTLRFSSGGSVGFWMKPKGTPPTEGYCIINKGNAQSRNPRVTLQSDFKINFFWEIADGTNQDTDATNAVNEGEWTYVVCTWDGTTNKIYLNDALDKSEAESGTPDTQGVGLYIGNDPSDADGNFKGQLDGITFYSDILSLEEVKRNYNATKGSHRN